MVQPVEDRASIIERALTGSGPIDESAQIRELFVDDETLIMKTEIPPGLIIPLSRAYTISHITKSRVLKYFCDMILKAQISKERKGRIEWMEANLAIKRASLEEQL